MKKNLFESAIAIVILVFLTGSHVSAQSDYRKGFVMLPDHDTLDGEIDYRGDLIMSSECRFRDKESNEKVYKPFEILGYQFSENGKYFVSKTFEGESYFFEYLINGELDVYYLRTSSGDRYFVEKDSFPLKELPYEKGIRTRDGKSYAFESKVHKGMLSIYMQDAPQLSSRVNALGEPNHSNMINLAKDYHDIVCKDENCIIYEKKKKSFKIALELTGGAFNFTAGRVYEDIINSAVNSGPTGGVVFHVWMPRTSEKLYLRTGFLILPTGHNYYGTRIVEKIPLMLEYLYPKYRLRPRLAYGFNFSPVDITVGAIGGFNLLLTDKLHITAQFEIEALGMQELPFLPQHNFGNTLSGGIWYQF